MKLRMVLTAVMAISLLSGAALAEVVNPGNAGAFAEQGVSVTD